MRTEPREVSYSVPIRRTRWPSFFVGAAALFVSALSAAACGGLLMWLPLKVDGAVIVILFGLLWGTGFFLSLPLQRRRARSLDARRPGMRLDGAVLAVPLEDGLTLRFKLEEALELSFGWSETVVSTVAAPTTHTRGVLTYAIVSQDGRRVFLKAEDSARAARAAGWLRSKGSPVSEPSVRLWADDLVALIEIMRARPR